jgi:hypothetical protein
VILAVRSAHYYHSDGPSKQESVDQWTDFRAPGARLVAGRLFSLVAIGCLAAAIAANTSMFSVFDAIFWRPLPFPDSNSLVTISDRRPDTGLRANNLSLATRRNSAIQRRRLDRAETRPAPSR